MLSLRTFILLCFASLVPLVTSTAEAAPRGTTVVRYHGSPYHASASVRYRGYASNRYYYPRSTFYGYGARRYNYRYRPYAAAASYRFNRPSYYSFYNYPNRSYVSYGFSSYYPRPFCNAWNSYSSCYCSPYSGYQSTYYPYYGNYGVFPGSYAPLWGSYAPYWGSYAPNWGGYYYAPFSYYPGYYGSFYGYNCGVWPYRPTLYGSLVFQSGYNMGYYGRSYYRFW